MSELRSIYANLEDYQHRLKATAALLGISENTLKANLEQSGIDVRRQSAESPRAPAVRIFDIPKVFEVANWRREQGLVKPVGKRPIFITVALIKGGVGKTTTVAELGVHLRLMGYKTLLIDLDSQANLTHLMGYEADLEIGDAEAFGVTSDAIVTETFATICKPSLESRRGAYPDMSGAVKRPYGPFGPALIPADTFSSDLELHIALTKQSRELVFDEVFKLSCAGEIPGLRVDDYDFVLMDCAPSVSFVTTNALAVADIVVAPVRMDLFAVKGLSKLVAELNGLRRLGRQPDLMILPTHFSMNVGRVARMQQKLQEYKQNLCPSAISSSEEINKAQEFYLPLTLQHPTALSAKEYRMVAERLVADLISKSRDRK